VCTFPLLHEWPISHTSHYSWFVHSNNLSWGVQTMKFLLIQPSSLLCYFVLLRLNCLPQCPVLKQPQPVFHRQCGRPSFK
jgi:hypothetical protein